MLSPPHILWLIGRNSHILTFWLIETDSNIFVMMRIDFIENTYMIILSMRMSICDGVDDIDWECIWLELNYVPDDLT